MLNAGVRPCIVAMLGRNSLKSIDFPNNDKLKKDLLFKTIKIQPYNTK